jgi:hypothetical protein
MRHFISKSIVSLLIAAGFLLVVSTFSSETETKASQEFHSSNLMLADDWECNDFI